MRLQPSSLERPRLRMPLLALGLAAILAGPLGCAGDQGTGNQDAAAPPGKIAPLTELDDEALSRIQSRLQAAYVAMRKGQPEESLEFFNAALESAPESPVLRYHLAVGLAAQDRLDEALDELQRAADGGFCNAGRLDGDPSLAAVRLLPGWEAVRAQVLANDARFREEFPVAYHELDPAAEPEFETLQELQRHYGDQMGPVAKLQLVNADCAVRPQVWELLDHKLAALERFRQKDLDEHEAMMTDLDILQTVSSYEDPQRTPWRESSVAAIIAMTRAAAERHPEDTEFQAHAAYVQAHVSWLQRRPQDPSQGDEGDVQRAVAAYVDVVDRFPGSRSGLQALMHAIEALEGRYGAGAPAMKPILERIRKDYGNHPDYQKVAYQLQPHYLAVEGLPAFSVTDLEGRTWDSQSLGDRVVLIDFWATWCAPCRAELPNLVKLYEKYKDRGFEILGISLDTPQKISTERLREWVATNGMTWPIVYDQKAWQSPAVQACGVTGIPFPILVDRAGNVAAAGGDATGGKLHAALAKLLGGA